MQTQEPQIVTEAWYDYDRSEIAEALDADELWARGAGEFDAAAFYQSLARALRNGQISTARVKGCTPDYLERCLLSGGASHDRVRPQDLPR